MAHSKLSREEMVAMRAEGVSVRRIAELAGLTVQTVYYHLGAAADGNVYGHVRTDRRLSREEMAALRKEGRTIKEIAESAGVSWHTVHYHLTKAAEGKVEGVWPARPSAISSEEMAFRYNKGDSSDRIAALAGIPKARVIQQLRTRGVKFRRVRIKPKRRIEPFEMVELHRQGSTCNDIAAIAGVSRARVQQLLASTGYSGAETRAENAALTAAVRSFQSLIKKALNRGEILKRWQEVYRLYELGIPDAEIAALVGVNHPTAASRMGRNWAKLHNLHWPLKLGVKD